jgi:glutamyl-Q tRNA(Asp) synthetase
MAVRRHRGRFAPSPTGPLHFGPLVTAVASHAAARAAGGQWLVRIEDVDQPRTQPGAEAAICDALMRHGMVADEPPVRQSSRTALYARALEHLQADGRVYACVCTRRELAAAPMVHGEHVYSGTCRNGIPVAHAARRQRSLRIRVPQLRIRFIDQVQGPVMQALASEAGDFVLRRADGWFSYQLAVVVDDAAQDITRVVRGADLLASTPRQIFLQRALGVPTPEYLHVPVVVDTAGNKLSKQTGAATLGADDPVQALLQAWRFLRQPMPASPPQRVGDFWSHAVRAWTPARVPPVPMLPAPAAV